MAYPRKLLGDGEEIVRDTRPHWKAVLVPAIVFVVMVGVGSYVAAIVPEGDLQPSGCAGPSPCLRCSSSAALPRTRSSAG